MGDVGGQAATLAGSATGFVRVSGSVMMGRSLAEAEASAEKLLESGFTARHHAGTCVEAAARKFRGSGSCPL